MKKSFIPITFAFAIGLIPCVSQTVQESAKKQQIENEKGGQTRPEPTPKQEKEIRSLISQLVLVDRPVTEELLPAPGLNTDDEEYGKRYNACHKAFKRLMEFKELSLPFLVEHLEDKRQSIPFRNHHMGFSVGDACYWNIYYQLQDQPDDYSSYGYQRRGRDGENHPKPYWATKGCCFDEVGGAKEWLEINKHLSYVEMRIKCLSWLLEKERAIGASDVESYYENIAPLEVRILERRLEKGEKVETELKQARANLKKKDPAAVPPGLLPAK
ncbi:hypothetical protein OJ996_11410 [Luteolibacter sp. GHJ8]|uniref:Lipoprotein n=1 Tax=Luteolibacter rhizosphaerae TaxID=2989719 RepID=A0ABT3G2X0_9BACT|nr:hypothetical protein [Luteolibacter rhizosphaerae]MCW1914186.1 hypothetical protein [Luteolibacter rhizosphaerae]